MATDKTHLLTQWRKEKGLSMQALAERVDCVQSFISQIESGERHPSLKMAAKLSRETGIPIEVFAIQAEAAQ
jgi:transcriptional regulator with XRE-family HTH domain